MSDRHTITAKLEQGQIFGMELSNCPSLDCNDGTGKCWLEDWVGNLYPDELFDDTVLTVRLEVSVVDNWEQPVLRLESIEVTNDE